MGVKEVKPGDVSSENILEKKKTRDIGSVGLDELVQKVQAKLEQKVEKVTTEQGEKTKETSELKKQYFNKVGVEKNMETSQAKAMRGNMTSGMQDARNLKLIVLPKLEKMADPVQVGTFGGKANITSPFQVDLSDVLGRLLQEVQDKPNRAQKRLDKLKEKAEAREKKFGKKIPPNDQDPNAFSEEEFHRQKRKKAVIKMYQYMNKALGQKMDMSGAPPEEPAKRDDDDDDE